MYEYPLNHFLSSVTFRRMIALRMSESAAGIQKTARKVISAAGHVDNIAQLENKSRPKLDKFAYQASIYEKDGKQEIQSFQNLDEPDEARMLASTQS